MDASIAHFGVDGPLAKKLTEGSIYQFPLTAQSLPHISDATSLRIMSVNQLCQASGDVLEAFPALKLLITRTVGTDHIDKELCAARGIAVYHVPDYGAYNVAEHALALALAGARRIREADLDVRAGKFRYEPFLAMGIKGKTVGVVGTGLIGRSFMKLLAGFDVKILAFDLHEHEDVRGLGGTYMTLDEVLARSDIVSLHLPLLPETKHIIGNKELGMMRKGSILVNTARGAIIDTEALIKHANKFHAICLDVLEDEQHTAKDNPLFHLPNVIVTPHIAFYTDDAVRRIGEETMRCIIKFEQGDREGRVV